MSPDFRSSGRGQGTDGYLIRCGLTAIANLVGALVSSFFAHANSPIPTVIEKAKFRGKGSLCKTPALPLIVHYTVPSLQNQDVMFADIHSLRCQVIVPGTHTAHKINSICLRTTVLGTSKHEHRRAPLHDVDGSHSRLILGWLCFRTSC